MRDEPLRLLLVGSGQEQGIATGLFERQRSLTELDDTCNRNRAEDDRHEHVPRDSLRDRDENGKEHCHRRHHEKPEADVVVITLVKLGQIFGVYPFV